MVACFAVAPEHLQVRSVEAYGDVLFGVFRGGGG
jgi:hypothetical protein